MQAIWDQFSGQMNFYPAVADFDENSEGLLLTLGTCGFLQ